VRPGAEGDYNGGVATGSGQDDEGGRPEFFTTQARFVLAVWLAVTLVLIAVYVIVLVLL
jgi:hypothetical protein